jgi:hypothetical protein
VLFLLTLFAGIFGTQNVLFAQEAKLETDTTKTEIHKGRIIGIAAGGGTLYAASMAVLSQAWYKDHPKSSFHFFDDSREWLQMDKAGHAFTSYYEGVYGIKMLKWAGLSSRQAAWYGGSWGFLLQTPIEFFDGHSADYGASLSDVAANTFGTALVISQELLWEEQKLQMKFSYSPSSLAQYRPNVLGSNFQERLLKDYNGQTYWLSFGLKDIMPFENKIPSWLNIAAGYGAYGMTGGMANPDMVNGTQIPEFNRVRQYYLSLDINLLKIKTRSRVLNTIFAGLAFIKIPAPAIEFRDDNKIKFHFLHF